MPAMTLTIDVETLDSWGHYKPIAYTGNLIVKLCTILGQGERNSSP